jgi:hypothetical protein
VATARDDTGRGERRTNAKTSSIRPDASRWNITLALPSISKARDLQQVAMILTRMHTTNTPLAVAMP